MVMGKIAIRGQHGALIISLIVTLVVMAALGAGMVYYTTTSSYGELLANRQARAYYLGESGANYAHRLFLANPVAGGPFPSSTTTIFTLSNGQFAVKTYDDSSDPANYLIIESTGIVSAGWLTTRQLVTKRINKLNSTPPGQPPTAPVGFDTNTNTQLDTTWAPTPGTDVAIVSTGPSGGPALQFKGDINAINLAWSGNQAAGAPDMLAAWSNNGELLSYALQVKINIDRQGSKGEHYLVGLSFRVIDTNNSYGLSFYRSNGTSGPAWWTSAAFADFRAKIPNDGKNYAVLWKKINGTSTVLNYAPMTPAYGVVTDATAQTLSVWSSLFIRVNERFDGPGDSRRNHLKAYAAGPGTYPLGTSNWNFSSFNQISWTWTNPPQPSPPVTEAIDPLNTAPPYLFTSEGFSTSRPEIGVHAFYDSNAANDQFFNGFGMAVQGTGSGGGGYQY